MSSDRKLWKVVGGSEPFKDPEDEEAHVDWRDTEPELEPVVDEEDEADEGAGGGGGSGDRTAPPILRPNT